MIPLWLLMSLGAIFCWSVWALLLKMAVEKAPYLNVTMLSIMVEAMLIFLLWANNRHSNEPHQEGWILPAAMSGIFGISGLMFFNRALKDGPLSVVNAITSVYPILTCLLSWVLLSESMTVRQVIAVVFAIVAVLLSA